jgi:hypothetical protein
VRSDRTRRIDAEADLDSSDITVIFHPSGQFEVKGRLFYEGSTGELDRISGIEVEVLISTLRRYHRLATSPYKG